MWMTFWMAAALVDQGMGVEQKQPPVEYSATVEDGRVIPAITLKIYRDGSKAVVDRFQVLPPIRPGGIESARTRTYYDLDRRKWAFVDLNYADRRRRSMGRFRSRPIAVPAHSRRGIGEIRLENPLRSFAKSAKPVCTQRGSRP